MKFLTKDEAENIILDFKIKPKSSNNATTGSYYDYMFKCGLYYNSKNDVLSLLQGKDVRGTGVDFLLEHIKEEYPDSHLKLKKIMDFR